MAPKNAEVIDNPPMGSSSEVKESGFSGEEFESSAEDSKKDESKLESVSKGESDSASDSDSKPAKKNKQPAGTLAESSDSEPAKKKNKESVVTSGSAVALPESSTAKRPLEQAESEANKKLKISATEHVKNPKQDTEVKKISGDEAKNIFQRFFSKTDEIALLQSVLDFHSTKRDPYGEIDAFCIHVKKLIDFDATKTQIVTKLRRLRQKYNGTVKKALKKGKSEDEMVFAKDLDQKVFELSRKIWGEDGSMASKSRKNLGETPKEKKLGETPEEKKLGETPEEKKLGEPPNEKKSAETPNEKKLEENPKEKKIAETPKEKKLGEPPKEMKLKPHSTPKKQEGETEKQESECSAEDSKKDESKLESVFKGKSDSASDSDSKPAKKNKQPAVTLPESSDSEPAKKKNKQSSSEVEESGSSGGESESSAEDSKKDESKLESVSKAESDSASDSDSKPAKKNNQPAVTLPESSDSEPAKKKNKESVVTSGSAVALPESSTAKRPLEQGESEANKKLKISATEHVKNPKQDTEVKKISGDEAKSIFQRFFSKTDEIALLQSVLDFHSTKRDPWGEIDAFCIHVKKLTDFDATKNQIVTKIRRLRKKYNGTVKKALKQGKSEDERVFAKDLDQKVFELSRKIWGEDGILASKSIPKDAETPKKKKLADTPNEKKLGETPKEMKLKPHSTPKKQQEETEKPMAKVMNTSLSIGREIASFFNTKNSNVGALDETTLAVVWEKVADGAEKRVVEKQWKKFKAKQEELCLQRTKLVNESAKMIFKAYES